MMRILHTESSNGWGGQEIRILRESEGMRGRGYEVVMAVAKGGGLVAEARKRGFTVYELNFKKGSAATTLLQLLKIIRKHDIELINTHSSLDAWLGGIAGRLAKKKVIRTRHLSTPIRKGLNSRLLYKALADFVVTTSSSIIPTICSQSKLSPFACKCIPTGIDPSQVKADPEEVKKFRESLKVDDNDILVGTACFVRSWKGINDFLQTALLLKDIKNLKWAIVGGGHLREYVERAKQMGLEETVIFTGHLESPYAAIAAMDIFMLLSTAHEGVSQASLQAAYLERPLITTPIGGLPEVCIEGKTGMLVPPFSPHHVADTILHLREDPKLRRQLGKNARAHIEEKFTFQQTLDNMEAVYASVLL